MELRRLESAKLRGRGDPGSNEEPPTVDHNQHAHSRGGLRPDEHLLPHGHDSGAAVQLGSSRSGETAINIVL